jgi:hypothetical protein
MRSTERSARTVISCSCAPFAIVLNVRERVNGSIFDKVSRAAQRYHADPAVKYHESVSASMALTMRVFHRRKTKDRYPNPFNCSALSRDVSASDGHHGLASTALRERNDPVAADRIGNDDRIIMMHRYREHCAHDALQSRRYCTL